MRARDRGFALVIVLVTTAGIFALATQASVATRAATIESRVAIERIGAMRGARAAVGLVIRGLTSAENTSGKTNTGIRNRSAGGQSLREAKPSIELPAIIKELLGSYSDDVEDGARRAPAGLGSSAQTIQTATVPHIPGGWVEVRLPQDRHVYRVRLSDATGQLNVNHVDAQQFQHFLTLNGVTPTLANSITDELLDWIDEDRFVRARGAEDERYRSLGVACANRPMRLRREMLYLPSMTVEIFRNIRDDLSVGGDGKLHVGSASREALMTLKGMDQEIAGRIIERRRLGPIAPKDLDDLLPLAAREARDQLRLASGPVLRVRVEVLEPGESRRWGFEGLAVVGAQGGVRSLHLHDRALDMVPSVDRDSRRDSP